MLLIILVPVGFFVFAAVLGHLEGLRAAYHEEVRKHIVSLIQHDGYEIIQIRPCYAWGRSPTASWPRSELAWRCDLAVSWDKLSSWIVVYGSARPSRDRSSVQNYRGKYLAFYRYP